MASRRWLLLLGSNRESDALVREALRRLDDIGPVKQLTDIRRFQAYGDGHGPYYNVLAQWRGDDERSAALSRLKALERELGRDPTDEKRVDIDIDVLGSAVAGGGWAADPHALAKNEFTREPVLALLHEAGIDIP
ncbi:MAG TPA: 2-amino-4-hydroxy-6-hydroxymethyldihydropteridine diphosphokinase [Oleiagrimonas sp.]|nr:2-amino-4-hydroxy-6-hydroxymethyldihydropteridine diphosphokinase [Oleiagrimonas sp.]